MSEKTEQTPEPTDDSKTPAKSMTLDELILQIRAMETWPMSVCNTFKHGIQTAIAEINTHRAALGAGLTPRPLRFYIEPADFGDGYVACLDSHDAIFTMCPVQPTVEGVKEYMQAFMKQNGLTAEFEEDDDGKADDADSSA